jgi:hypothetical protein
MILIGSRALHFWDSSFPLKEDSDWDVISGPPVDRPGFEWHHEDFLNNKDVATNYGSGFYITLGDLKLEVCTLEGLAAIKRSHLWRDWFFDKHITQYHKHLRPYFKESQFYFDRIALTKEAFRQGNPSLKRTNKEFFDDPVKKVYDHDWLHELVAYEDAPMYTRLKRDDSLAWCEKDLWGQLDDTRKLRCVAEETYVIAIERFMVPNQWEFSPKQAYHTALKKVCTTLTSGWFRDYALDNYPEVMALFDIRKFSDVKDKIHAARHPKYYRG